MDLHRDSSDGTRAETDPALSIQMILVMFDGPVRTQRLVMHIIYATSWMPQCLEINPNK